MGKISIGNHKRIFIAVLLLIIGSVCVSCMRQTPDPGISSSGSSLSVNSSVMSASLNDMPSNETSDETRSVATSRDSSTDPDSASMLSAGGLSSDSAGSSKSFSRTSSGSESKTSIIVSSSLSPTPGLNNITGYKAFLKKAAEGKAINIAFLGGSITAGASYANWGAPDPYKGFNLDGTPVDVTQYWSYSTYGDLRDSWRGRVFNWLKTSYQTKAGQFTQINAAIGATDSLFGALRLEDHVFARGIPDVIFIEYVVNDNGKNADEVMKAYESIVKRVRLKNPDCAIFFAFSSSRQKSDAANPAFYDVIINCIRIAKDYADFKKIPYADINNAYYYSNLTETQKTALFYGPKSEFGYQVHPSPYGHEVFAGEVIKVLKSCFTTNGFAFNNVNLTLPEAYPQNGKMIFGDELLTAMPASTAAVIPDDPRQHKCLTFHKMLVCTDLSSELDYSFKGTAIWLWLDYSYTNYKVDIYVDDTLISNDWTFENAQLKFLKGSMLADKTHTLRIVMKAPADGSRPFNFSLRGLAIENYKQQ
ncbi:MAG: SGNH/GDSL hydrolase family protein [Saccharofermentanales bacterium]